MRYPLIRNYIYCLILCSVVGCTTNQSKTAENQYAEAELKGKQLSEKYCVGCHLLPEPSLLDKESWRKVLPVMQEQLRKKSIPVFYLDWIALENYYIDSAPNKLSKINNQNLTEQIIQFKEDRIIDLPDEVQPNLTLLKYLPDGHLLCMGDEKGKIYLLKSNVVCDTFSVDNIPIDISRNNKSKEFFVLGIGNLYPSQEKKGQLIGIDSTGHQHVVIDSLVRPVSFLLHDFNNDGEQDFLVSSFGSIGKVEYGKLSLYISNNGVITEHVIKEQPGALKAEIGDFNGDKQIDIIAMFSQGRESINMFLNNGDLTFNQRVLAEFPPSYGTNNFTMADVNSDSYGDIICTQGDNGDYSPIFKSYHGVRVLINDGKNTFTERYFFAINGASRVITDDFDKDGDIDLFVLASFPDLTDRAQETLIYFENTSDITFKPFYIEEKPTGKWLLMESVDLDGNGYNDIIVGANRMKTIDQSQYYTKLWASEKKVFLMLKNQGNSNTPWWKSLFN